MASYQVSLREMGPSADVAAACAAFAAERGLDLLVLMPSFEDGNGVFTRQLAFVPSPEGSAADERKLIARLVDAIGPEVGALTPATEVEGPLAGSAFYMGDPKASRKKIQPLLLEQLSREGMAKL